jgi:hypothetical protein
MMTPEESGPDYQEDMNACMELWEEGNMCSLSQPTKGGVFLVLYDDEKDNVSRVGGTGKTSELAIIAAYLKSKGVELGEDK